MRILLAAVCGFLVDQVLGDPAWMPHPVVCMGRLITFLEKKLRKIFPATASGQLCAGSILAVLLPVISLTLSAGCIFLAGLVHPALAFLLEVLWCWQVLAVKGLKDESENVRLELVRGDLPGARKAVGRIVGRDTENLSAEGVTKAAVETVAENFSDGVAAPLLYCMIGGAPLGLMYKAVNTMDSMVGYQNEKYLYFGRAAAKLDDAANYIPARLSALLLVGAAAMTGGNARDAFRIWRRDRRCHASPNSAQTESAAAGALGIQLAGDASYFGKVVEKPTIGDRKRAAEPADIGRMNRMMVAASVLGLFLFGGIRFIIWCVC